MADCWLFTRQRVADIFRRRSFFSVLVRGLLGTDPRTPPSNPPRPQGSIWHRNRVKSGNRCRIDAESTPEEGRARWIRGWGPGGLCLINPCASFPRVFVSFVSSCCNLPEQWVAHLGPKKRTTNTASWTLGGPPLHSQKF